MWVDFQRDVMFVGACSRRGMFSKSAPCEAVAMLRHYAKEEIGKIMGLAIAGEQGSSGRDPVPGIVKALRGRIGSALYVPGGVARRLESWFEWMDGFEGLKELLLDPSFGDSMGVATADIVLRSVLISLEKARKNDCWRSKLRVAKVVRGNDWHQIV